MRKLIVSTFLTLDCVMQAPGGPEEDTDGELTSGGRTVTSCDEAMGRTMGVVMGVPFDLMLGRRTYDIFASFWPTAPEKEGAGPLNAATKYVASRGPLNLDWENSVQLEGDVTTAIARLKESEGPELQARGSSNLLQTLIAANLVDEYRLLIFPGVVGPGKRLFGNGTVPAGLTLVESEVSTSGVLMATYRPVGELQTGTFG